MTPLSERRFVFVTGKGGVGKTTVAAALARSLSAEGKRVLVAMCNAKERLSPMFGAPPLGPEIGPLAENVWGVNIEPERALEEYGAMMLKVRTVYRTVFENKYVRAFFRAVPGMHEWAMLGKAWFHTTETERDGRRRFDVVILDAPATGHGLDMLRVPKVIMDVAPAGLLRREAEKAWSMFLDEAQTGVVVVTLPEELPTTETIELVRSLVDELGLPVVRLVVNGVLPALFSPHERASLVAYDGLEARPDDAALAALAAAARRATREEAQARNAARLDETLGLPTIALPHLFRDATAPDAIAELARHF